MFGWCTSKLLKMEFNVDDTFLKASGDSCVDKDEQVNDHYNMTNVCSRDSVESLDSESETNGGNNDLANVSETETEDHSPLSKNRIENSGGESCENYEYVREMSALEAAVNTSKQLIEKQRDDGQLQTANHQTVPSTDVSSLNIYTEINADDVAPIVENEVSKIEDICDKSNNEPKLIKFCDICSSENIEMGAISFCTTCMEYLCENCHRFHSKCKATKDHEVIVDKIPDDISVFKWMAKIMSCPQHPEYKVSYICYDHKINVCLTCLVEDHRKCSNTRKLADVVARVKDKTKDTTENIDAHLQSVTSHIAQRRKNIVDIVIDRDDILHSISDQADNLIEVILSLKMKAEQEVREMAETEIKVLKEEINICTELEDEEAREKKVIDVLAGEGFGFDTDILRYVIWGKVRQHKEALSQLKTKSKHLHFIKNQDAIMTVSFGDVTVFSTDDASSEPQLGTSASERPKDLANGVNKNIDGQDQKIPSIAAKCDSEEFDYLSTNSNHNGVLKPVLDFGRPFPMMTAAQSLPELNKVEPSSKKVNSVSKVDKFTVRLVADTRQCCISKCVVLKSGSVALLDSANQKLKKFDQTFQKCSYLILEGHVDDICNPKGEEVAILYDSLHKLVVRILTGSASGTIITIQLPPDQHFKSIAADKKTERFALVYETKFGAHPKTYYHIQLRSYTGDVLCDFDMESLIGFDIEVPLNSENFGICYSPKGLIIIGDGLGIRYIPAQGSNKELVLLKSKVLYPCNDKEMQGMTNRTCDIKGNIYTCSSSSGGVIVQYNRTKNHRPTIMLSGIPRPLCVDFISDKKLVVGCKNDDSVQVYTLKNSLK